MKILGKLGRMLGAIVIVSMLTFGMTKLLPGDPTFIELGSNAGSMLACGSTVEGKTLDCKNYPAQNVVPRGTKGPPPLEDVCDADQCITAGNRLRHDKAYDKPIPVQYAKWAGNALHGDFGEAIGPPPERVSTKLSRALPPTLELMLLASLASILIAIPLGIYGAYRENRLGDRVATGVSFFMLAIPNFVLALYLIALFAVTLHWLPLTFSPLKEGLADNLKSQVMPVLALAAGSVAVFARLLRSDMIATLHEDFILMARAKGLPPWRILFQHALRPSSFSLLTVVGINLGSLIGGTVILEVMFAIDGVGKLMVTAISTRDYMVVQAVVLIISVTYVVANVLIDILYNLLDPRIRHA